MGFNKKKSKLKEFAILICLLLAFLGLFIGPTSWYFSASFNAEYENFADGAIEAPGIVHKRWKKIRGRGSTCYLSVSYNKTAYKITLVNKIKVLHTLNVEPKDKITVLYHPNGKDSDIRIKGEAEWRNLPPIQKPYFGMIYTFYSYLILIYLLIKGRQKKKLLAKTKP